jgi:glycosyltransferase involved in cell wall biosynthesis
MSSRPGPEDNSTRLENSGEGRDCCVVIPCLNEAAAIGALVQAAKKFVPCVIVVDDGSSDATADEAAKAGARTIRHSEPQGKGAALNRAFAAASRDCGFQWALAMDGDGQHSPEDIPAFLRWAGQVSVRMIVGNRMENASRMPWLRRGVNRWMSARLSRFCGVPLPDSQCGFRLIHLESWSHLQFSARNFEIESELLVRFAWAGLGVEFIPVQTLYAREQSKIRPAKDTIRWFRWWHAIRTELKQSPREPIILEKAHRSSRGDETLIKFRGLPKFERFRKSESRYLDCYLR